MLDDEYHFVLQCQKHALLRERYIGMYFYKNPSMFKFIQLMSTSNVKTLNNLAIFVKKAFANV